MTQAKSWAGPSYAIWTSAVIVGPGLSIRMIFAAAARTALSCDDHKPPNACARGLVPGESTSAATQAQIGPSAGARDFDAFVAFQGIPAPWSLRTSLRRGP